MKEMSSVAATVMSEEEGTETEKDSTTPPITTPPITTTPLTPQSNPSRRPSADEQTSTADNALTAFREDTPSVSVSNSASPPSPSKGSKKDGKKRNRLSPEQRKKLQALEEERKKALEERVKSLTTKLLERLRPFVEAKHPGDPNDPETKVFQEKIQREAEDMKLASFGVEVRPR